MKKSSIIKKKNVEAKVDVVMKPQSSKTVAENIWDDIKDLKLNMFALPNQLVSVYYKPINVEPNRLFLVALTQATSVLPALETTISEKYLVEQIDRFIIVTSKIK